MGKKFDFVIGNPPYQDERLLDSDQKNYAAPVYHLFLDEAFKIADVVEMIHPARCLFNAGSTPKEWNQKILSDQHFQIKYFESESTKLFLTSTITGGVVISYRDAEMNGDPIGTFIPDDNLRSIVRKAGKENHFIDEIILPSESYRFTNQLHQELPESKLILSKGHLFDMKTSVFTKLNNLAFFDSKTTDDLVKVFGTEKGKRVEKYIKRSYIQVPDNFRYYRVFVPAANGSKQIGGGEPTMVMGNPFIAKPYEAHTQTYISIGSFHSENEAQAALKYIKTKFSRALLSSLKATQHNPPEKWKKIPIQDFSDSSDVDWTKSIPEIDQQLYKKYNLSTKEIEFIESHIKEMN